MTTRMKTTTTKTIVSATRSSRRPSRRNPSHPGRNSRSNSSSIPHPLPHHHHHHHPHPRHPPRRRRSTMTRVSTAPFRGISHRIWAPMWILSAATFSSCWIASCAKRYGICTHAHSLGFCHVCVCIHVFLCMFIFSCQVCVSVVEFLHDGVLLLLSLSLLYESV